MACERIVLPGTTPAIVCGVPRRRCKCGAKATLLCDWKTPAKRSGTCDAPICARCATAAGPGKDICPAHRPQLEAWQANRQARGAA